MPAGSWVDPANNEMRDDVFVALGKHAVVLLGETHDEVEHHRWQLHTIAVPFGHRPASVSRCFRGAFALRWQRAERSELG